MNEDPACINYESESEDSVGHKFLRSVVVIDGRGREQVIEGTFIDTCSHYSLIALGRAQGLHLAIHPLLDRKELKVLGSQINASWFVRLRVCLRDLDIPWETLNVLVVDIDDSDLLLLGRCAMEKLQILPKLAESTEAYSSGQATSFNRNHTLVILGSRRTKKQEEYDEQVRQQSAEEASRLAVIRMHYDNRSSITGSCSSASESSACLPQSASSSAGSSTSRSVFSRGCTSTSDATTIASQTTTFENKGRE